MEIYNNIQVKLIDKEEVSKALIESYLKDAFESISISKYSDVEQAINDVLEVDNTILIVDVTDDLSRINDIVENKQTNRCKFILTSYHVDANFVVEALRGGARDFLGKPVIKDELIGAFKRVADEFSTNIQTREKSKVISTFSNKGGLGKTTLAVNLAKELADSTKEKVVLVDLNMHLGDITAFLDINPNYDIKYIVDNIDKADGDFLLATLEQYKTPNFYILADSPFREQVEELSASDLIKLIEVLKKTFAYVIIDNSSILDNKTISVLDFSDLILLITTANLPTLRNCQRCLNIFDKMGYDDSKLKIVLNRFLNNEGYTIEDVEKALNRPVFWQIPNNYIAVIESINKGITLREHNSSSNITDNYRQLAREITNRV